MKPKNAEIREFNDNDDSEIDEDDEDIEENNMSLAAMSCFDA